MNIGPNQGVASTSMNGPISLDSMSGRLHWARERAGYKSARAAALALGLKTSTFSAHHNGQNNFDETSAKLYGKAFGVSWIWLLHGTGTPEPTAEETASYAQMPALAPAPVKLPKPNAIVGDKITTLGKSIPVFGSAVGGVDGEFVMNGSVLYEVLAPPVLNAVSGAYAVLISGESMEPRYFDGETAYIDPMRRVIRGDFVVAQVQLEDEGPILAYVKRFVRHNAEELVLEQFNPPKQLKFPHENVVSVHYIAMSGWA